MHAAAGHHPPVPHFLVAMAQEHAVVQGSWSQSVTATKKQPRWWASEQSQQQPATSSAALLLFAHLEPSIQHSSWSPPRHHKIAKQIDLFIRCHFDDSYNFLTVIIYSPPQFIHRLSYIFHSLYTYPSTLVVDWLTVHIVHYIFLLIK
jgi:hypothetical protein